MKAATAEALAKRFAESRSEWRQLQDAAALDAFLAEAGWTAGEPVGLLDDGRGFSLADALIIETGTLLLTAHFPGARSGAFLAETHFALCAEENLIERLGDFLAAAGPRWLERCGHSLTLITGPSRTADIEKVLVLGAHGPRRLVIGTAPAALLATRFEAEALPPGLNA